MLAIAGTGVRDLSPLRALTALRSLHLYGLQVTDLSPLRNLSQLATDPMANGLVIGGTAAVLADPALATIADIHDARDRAEAVFAYLDRHQP
jgi:hypothetical protein